VVVGSTAEGLATALALHRSGIAVAAVVEQAAAPAGPAALAADLEAAGIALLCGHPVLRAVGTGEVTGLAAAAADGREVALACDTIVLAVGAVPVVELLDAAGCAIGFDARRGGYAPVLDEGQATTLPFIRAVGDCAGTWPAKSLDRRIAEAEGRRAAEAVVQALAGATPLPQAPVAEPGGFDAAAYRLAWVRGTVLAGGEGVPVCRCEEVTARDILEVRPPRYLGWPQAEVATGANAPALASLIGDGPPDQDQIKRLTRAGMGVCQGRRCREQVAALLALGAHVDPGDIRLASHRTPVRPLPLARLGALAMAPAMAAHWDTWFGMASQSVPFWEIPADD
jgi:hypothetical protein